MAHWGHNTKPFCPHLVMCDCCTGNDFFVLGRFYECWWIFACSMVPRTIRFCHVNYHKPSICVTDSSGVWQFELSSEWIRVNKKLITKYERNNMMEKSRAVIYHNQADALILDWELTLMRRLAWPYYSYGIACVVGVSSVVLPFLLIELNLSVQGWS